MQTIYLHAIMNVFCNFLTFGSNLLLSEVVKKRGPEGQHKTLSRLSISVILYPSFQIDFYTELTVHIRQPGSSLSIIRSVIQSVVVNHSLSTCRRTFRVLSGARIVCRRLRMISCYSSGLNSSEQRISRKVNRQCQTSFLSIEANHQINATT